MFHIAVSPIADADGRGRDGATQSPSTLPFYAPLPLSKIKRPRYDGGSSCSSGSASNFFPG